MSSWGSCLMYEARGDYQPAQSQEHLCLLFLPHANDRISPRWRYRSCMQSEEAAVRCSHPDLGLALAWHCWILALWAFFLIRLGRCGTLGGLVQCSSPLSSHQLRIQPQQTYLQKPSGQGQQSSCQDNSGFQEAHSQCLLLRILTSLMRMLIQSEQLCPWGGLPMIFQIAFIDCFEQWVSEFCISRITNFF